MANGERAARWQGSKWIRRSTRLALYHRDGFACVYCGEGVEATTLTLDHVQPVEVGGSNASTNLVTACLSCNSAKRDLSMRSWFVVLRDRGIDTTKIGARIRRLVQKPLDRAEGRRLAAMSDDHGEDDAALPDAESYDVDAVNPNGGAS